MRLLLSSLLVLPLVACAATHGSSRLVEDSSWAAVGTWTDACCCKVSCPCLFGSGPTEGFCEGASLFVIDSGRHGGVRLDGVAAVVTYRVKGWTRVDVDERASPEQVAAMGALVPELLPFVRKGAEPIVSAARLDVAREGPSIRYASPHTTVELTLVESAGGEPIRLQNLPAKGTPFPITHDHTQYVSKRLAHGSESGTYEWSGRNGFTSRFDLTGAVEP